MTLVHEVSLGPKTVRLLFGEHESLELQNASKESYPASIGIKYFERSITLEQFSDVLLSNVGTQTEFIPYLSAVCGEADWKSFTLIGLRKVFSAGVEMPLGVFHDILSRRDDDDTGFYRHVIFPMRRAVVIAFECEVLKIGSHCELAWRYPLDYDDAVREVDDQFVYLECESGNRRLSLADGNPIN